MIKDILINRRESKRTAVVYKGYKYTYRDVYNKVENCVKQIGSVYGNNIGICRQNSIEDVVLDFAITGLDKVIVPIEVDSKERQIISTLEYCEISLILTNNQNFEYIERIVKLYSKNQIKIFNVDFGRGELMGGDHRVKYSEPILGHRSKDDVAIMLHTSGTTSLPKKVMLTNENIIMNVNSNIESLQLKDDEVCLIVLPMYFGYCHTSQFLTMLYLGATLIIYDGVFNPARFLKMVDEYKCTYTTCVPSMLFVTTKMKRERYSLESLKYLCFGGGTMPIAQLRNVLLFFNQTGVVQTYGQTEASPRLTCLLPNDATRKMGSVGKAIPGVKIEIVDEEGNVVATGKVGEIVAKGKNIMKGYYKRRKESEKVLRDGWLHTGDLGRFDEEGYLYIVGRIKNVIISGGINVYPEEIEDVLLTNDNIKEAFVFGKEHEILGEVPIAKVVVKSKSNITKQQIIAYCQNILETRKVPVDIIFCKELEKTNTGKIKRKVK